MPGIEAELIASSGKYYFFPAPYLYFLCEYLDLESDTPHSWQPSLSYYKKLPILSYKCRWAQPSSVSQSGFSLSSLLKIPELALQ